MTYTRQFWEDESVSKTTPITAARLTHIERGVEAAHDMLKPDALSRAITAQVAKIPAEDVVSADRIAAEVTKYFQQHPVAPGEVSEEKIAAAVTKYFQDNPPASGVPEDLNEKVTEAVTQAVAAIPDTKFETAVGEYLKKNPVEAGEVSQEDIAAAVTKYLQDNPVEAGEVSEEKIKAAVTEHFRQNPPTVDGLNEAIQREVKAAVAMILVEKPSALQKWIDPNKRYWAPVTYWWADQAQPESKWNAVWKHIDSVPFVVLNPKSGVGDQEEADFKALADKVRASGKPNLGYVKTVVTFETEDAARVLREKDEVLAEIKKYRDWYNVEGVFVDEMVNGWSAQQEPQMQFYIDLYQELKRLYGAEFLVVANPGVNTKPELLGAADILLSFENSAEKYLDDSEEATPIAPDHYKAEAAGRFWHAIHNVEDAKQLRKILLKASESNVAAIFPTTDTFTGVQGAEAEDNNPWDNLPASWAIEMAVAWARRQDDIWLAAVETGPSVKDTSAGQLVRTGPNGFIQQMDGPWDIHDVANKSYVDWKTSTADKQNFIEKIVPHGTETFEANEALPTLYIVLPETVPEDPTIPIQPVFHYVAKKEG